MKIISQHFFRERDIILLKHGTDWKICYTYSEDFSFSLFYFQFLNTTNLPLAQILNLWDYKHNIVNGIHYKNKPWNICLGQNKRNWKIENVKHFYLMQDNPIIFFLLIKFLLSCSLENQFFQKLLSSSLIWLFSEAVLSTQAALLHILQNRASEINYMWSTSDGSGISQGSSEGYPLVS